MSLLAARLIGLVAVVALGAAAALPADNLDRQQVSERFAFNSTTLDYAEAMPHQRIRAVHPAVQAIAPWISAVGAAAAIGDVDGNMQPDDVCLVDTRTNQVQVAPLLTARYRSFVLDPPAGVEPANSIAPMGCLIADLNEDGLPDLLVYYWGRPPVAFLRIDRGSTTLGSAPDAISYRAIEIAGQQRWFSNAALLADIDGDGHLDLIIGNYFCDDARILDASSKQPVCPHPVMQDSMSRAFNGGTNRIMLWRAGSGGAAPQLAYSDIAEVFADQVSHGWTLAIGAQDLDGDGLSDLYFANDFGPDRLLINCSQAKRSFGMTRAELGCSPIDGALSFKLMEGERTFNMPRSKVLGQDSFKSMGVDFADVDGDGVADIFVSNITEKWALQESQFMFVSGGRRIDAQLVKAGMAPYVDRSEPLGLSRSGWAWDAKLADFDNDGQPEALQAIGFVRGQDADAGLVWRKSCWANLQELATTNDVWLKYAASWFHMRADSTDAGCDLSGNARRNPFFVRQPSGRYADASPWLAHLVHGEPAPTRGLAIGDTDLDGRLDYIEAKQFAPAEFHRNLSLSAQRNTFIGLSPRFLVGAPDAAIAAATAMPLPLTDARRLNQRSRPAIGVHAAVRLSDGRRFNVEVDGGNGHSGKRSPDIHIGLGHVPAGITADLALSWRSTGSVTRTAHYTKVPVGIHLFAFLQP